jgi:hypothetical protein
MITTHTHNNFEWLSPRDYIDTKSWLAYDQNPYSINWVRPGSCHREMSLGCDILPAITRLRGNKNIRLLHDATTPQCSMHGCCATYTRPVQPCVTAPSSAWLDSTITSMTQQHHRQHDSTSTSHCGQVAPAAPSLVWLDIYIAPRSSRPSSTVASMTQ